MIKLLQIQVSGGKIFIDRESEDFDNCDFYNTEFPLLVIQSYPFSFPVLLKEETHQLLIDHFSQIVILSLRNEKVGMSPPPCYHAGSGNVSGLFA